MTNLDVEQDLYEVVVHYYEPQYQIIHLTAESAEDAKRIILEKTEGLKLKDFVFRSITAIDGDSVPLN